ncbi:MAG: hypothetical protein ABIJ12_07710, partial [bacterium]
LVLFSATLIIADESQVCRVIPNDYADEFAYSEPASAEIAGKDVTFNGRIKLIMVEPDATGRYYYDDGRWVQHAFLNFALNTSIALEYQETQIDTVTWDGSAYDIQPNGPYLTEDNIMVVAVVSDDSGYTQNGIPGYGFAAFTAYNADAVAYSDGYHSIPNQVTEDFTHTVLGEEAMAYW